MCDRSHLAEEARAYAQALEARARRAARSAGLVARKSRWRANSIDNSGGFMLVDPYSNVVVDGSRYDLSAEYVIDYCRSEDGGEP
jgi:hypothetical protein